MKHDHRFRPANLDGGEELRERRPPRSRVCVRCTLQTEGGPPLEVVLEDVSYRGFKMTTPVPLLVGSKIFLDIPGLGTVPAQVRWCLGGRVGGLFLIQLAGDAFNHLEDSEDGGTPRQAPRLPVMLQVGLRRSCSRKVTVRLLDLSTHGFKIESFDRIDPGETIWLTLPGMEGRQATVAWVKADQIGCRFEQPLHPAVLDAIVNRR